MLKKILWILPFASFIGGYIFVTSLLRPTDITMPSLLGKSLPEAFSILGTHTISARLLAYKSDPDLADGTVISQIPAPGKRIKPRQTALLTLSQKPSLVTAPNLIGACPERIASACENAPYTIKKYDVESVQPAGICISQSPAAHEPLHNEPLLIYCAQKTQKPVIWPSFIDQPLEQVLAFLHRYEIEPQITYIPTDIEPECPYVIDQRPLAGTVLFLDWSTPPIVQLHVQ